MNALVERFGAGPVGWALLVIGIIAALQPFYTARERRRWPRVKAKVVEVSSRRSITSGKWTVTIAFEANGALHHAEVAMNILRNPLKPGDSIEVMHAPNSPSRVALTPYEGASTGAMVAGLCLLGAVALLS